MSEADFVLPSRSITGHDDPPLDVDRLLRAVKGALALVSHERYARRTIVIGVGAPKPPPGITHEAVVQAELRLREALMWLEAGRHP